jgi:hypothetical protein
MDIKDVYTKSAALLEEAKDDFLSARDTGEHHEFLSLKLMASLIHNDVCREFYNLTVNKTTGTSRLLALGPIVIKLFEAHLWYSQIGNKRLRELAKSRGMLELIENKLREMNRLNPGRIEKYADIRNKLIAHYPYNYETVRVVQEFGSISADDFFEDITMMVRYALEWLQALKAIGRFECSDRTV